MGQHVLACGLRTFTAAVPPLDDSERPDGDVVVLCGETDETTQEDAAEASVDRRRRGARTGKGDSGGGGGGGDNTSRILNSSCLEVTLDAKTVFFSGTSDQGAALELCVSVEARMSRIAFPTLNSFCR